MRNIYKRCIIGFVSAFIAVIVFSLGYLSGQNPYRKWNVEFTEKQGVLKMDIGIYNIFFNKNINQFILSRRNSMGSLERLLMEVIGWDGIIDYDIDNNPQMVDTYFFDGSGGLDAICSTEKNISSDKIERIIFSYNPCPDKYLYGNSTYIDEDGDGTFDFWIIYPDRNCVEKRIVFRLTTSPPYISPGPYPPEPLDSIPKPETDIDK